MNYVKSFFCFTSGSRGLNRKPRLRTNFASKNNSTVLKVWI